jgi:hypothetical protein
MHCPNGMADQRIKDVRVLASLGLVEYVKLLGMAF